MSLMCVIYKSEKFLDYFLWLVHKIIIPSDELVLNKEYTLFYIN